MNKDQYNYDIGVQILNRSNDIKALEVKLDRLKVLRTDIYKRGQADKRIRRRENTLIEYREKVNTYDEKIQQIELLADTLKRRNGLIVDTKLVKTPKQNTPKTPKQDTSKTPKQDTSKTPKQDTPAQLNKEVIRRPPVLTIQERPRTPPSPPYYPFILGGEESDSPTSPPVPFQKNDELQDWIIQFYDLEFNTLEKINKTLVALEQEITATADALETQKKNQRDCCF